ncbi:MAG: ABC transporter ATP-binding protein [Lachnospiraceae bacterium]|jgi:ABC-2 type transport system ATP-binding protein|nr:ABC transporter ATP-binding protein [Lachnospiraceae bacterium]
MIKAEHIVKYFDRFCALDHVNLHVPKGSIYGLVGPNGAGKSTLIRHITGIYRPNEGQVLIDGTPVYENAGLKSQIAYIPDDLFYFAQADTLEMKRFYAGLYPSFDHALFTKLRDFFPAIDVKRNIRKLSKGMQKQVAFWLSLCCNPRVLILDEPVDGLDPVMRRQLWGLILDRVQDMQATVLISSHNLRELEDVCDHVGIMHQGKLLLEHSLCELQNTVSKIQIAFEHGLAPLPEQFQVLHMSNMGRVYTLILKGNPSHAKAELEKLHPLLIDVLPLTLEEIFIYEMGGANYAVKDILVS